MEIWLFIEIFAEADPQMLNHDDESRIKESANNAIATDMPKTFDVYLADYCFIIITPNIFVTWKYCELNL